MADALDLDKFLYCTLVPCQGCHNMQNSHSDMQQIIVSKKDLIKQTKYALSYDTGATC
jgi:hypothetical protein